MPADPRVGVGSAAIFLRGEGEEQEILLLHRVKNATHGGGTWGAPGGWIDWGQSPEEAAAREADEEVAVHCLPEDGRLIGVVNNTYPEQDKHIICLCVQFDEYDASELTNVEPEKADAVKWVPLRELVFLDLFPPLRDLAVQQGWV